ncbi:hypothetical protein GALL_69120 [mine drainage metagenome]|uniref:Uncharacterized protein n=1 Tax=mine drainage metagenome TaxID=410659 RepID=A0A1J5STW2_9ZZZZ
MNEEQAVLDFFSQEANLPLAVIAAEHLDAIRLRLNNEFWLALRKRLDPWLAQQSLPWSTEVTEDRNNEDCLVGVYLQPHAEQAVFLRVFMEQQFLGDHYRIFYGLMWNNVPDASKKTLPAVEALRVRLGDAGFKHSDSFLGWQWLPWHPRRRDFLLPFITRREELLDDAMRPWQSLLLEHGEQLRLANAALQEAPRSAVVSLDQLRGRSKS